jgi:integrase
MAGKLTIKGIEGLKPTEKARFHLDGGGLYLMVLPSGTKSWRFRYDFQGKRKQASLGKFPDLSLARAREIARDKRSLLRQGEDPFRKHEERRTFKGVALTWYENNVKPPLKVKRHAESVMSRLENHLFPYIGMMDIAKVEPTDLLYCLKRIADRGHLETVKRVRGIAGQVFRYGIIQGFCKRDMAADLRDAFPSPAKNNYPFISDPRRFGELLRDIENYHGSYIVRQALKVQAHTFLRPGELRTGEWSEIDFDHAEWHIPAEKMKKKRPHIVPLSRQVIEVLKEVQFLTGDGRYIFVATGHQSPLSDNTIRAGLRRMGYSKEELVVHSFRHTASTSLHEMGFESHVIEAQLAHIDGSVKGVYNKAQYLEKRKTLMQAWSDYLDALRGDKEGKVIQFKKVR